MDLYCFVNLKKHFFACTATYEANSSLMNRCLSSSSVPVILDVGCGPGTALLALADRFGGIRAHYFGIDQSSAMRAKAHTLWKAARSWGLIHKTSKATYVESWNDLGTEATDPNAGVLVLFSYLFASHTLTWKILKSLATFVRRLADSRRNGPLVWVYVNSSQPFAGKNYEIFEHELGLQPSSLRPAVVEYRKKRGGDVAKEEYVGEVVRVGG